MTNGHTKRNLVSNALPRAERKLEERAAKRERTISRRQARRIATRNRYSALEG